MGSMNVFASGAWRKAKGAHVFAGGAWRKAKAVWVFTGGSWRKVTFGPTVTIQVGSGFSSSGNYTQYGLVRRGFTPIGNVLSQDNQIPELGDVTEVYTLEYATGRSFNINTAVPGVRWLDCEFVSSNGSVATARVRANYPEQVPEAVYSLFKSSVGGTVTITYNISQT